MADQYPAHAEPEPPFGEQVQEPPRRDADMEPLAALVTGADSGIGRAVAPAFAREAELGGLDVLVNNAGYQMAREPFLDIPSEEIDCVFTTNVIAMFHLCQARGAEHAGRRDDRQHQLDPGRALSVLLATDASRYVSGEVIGATGVKPLH
jgi:NAD(P)-dependent dehydrogenase (short-subunit alcohol dehydrogenase family)